MSLPRRAAIRVLMGAVLVTGACRSDAPEGAALAPATVRDSAGVTIVENPAPADAAAPVWTVGPSPALEIGVLEGPDEYQLFRVTGALRLPDGRIAVLNAGSQEVRVYSADGSHVESWGGRGEGPGEFVSPASISRWPGDSVAVWDSRLRRLSLFVEGGVLGRTLTFPALEGVAVPTFSHVRGDGNTVVRGNSMVSDDLATGILRPPVEVAIVDANGSPVASLGAHPGREAYVRIGENSVEIIGLPFYRNLVIRSAGSTDIIGSTDRLQLSYWDGAGTLVRIVRVATPVRLFTEAERSAELDRRLANAPEAAKPGLRVSFEELPAQDTLPAFSDVVVDAGQNVWVRPFRLPVEEGPVHWLVLDPEGQILGRVTLPEALSVYEIGGDYILGSATDDLGVERVQVWSLQRR